MKRKEIFAAVRERFADRILAEEEAALEPHLRVAAATWPELARFLKEECGVDLLSCLTGVDRGDELEAIYNLECTSDAQESPFSVRVAVPRGAPEIPSVEQVWRTADWHEREAWDLLGIRFVGHPDLKRILCAEDWEGHPLRKDYRSPDYYHGIRNNVV